MTSKRLKTSAAMTTKLIDALFATVTQRRLGTVTRVGALELALDLGDYTWAARVFYKASNRSIFTDVAGKASDTPQAALSALVVELEERKQEQML